MPKSVTEYFGIDKERFKATGALDILLDLDSLLYIDPHLLKVADTPELQGSYETFCEHFAKLLQVLRHSRHRDDPFWRAADDLLDFPEVSGLCLGYGKAGTTGSGMGSELRAALLETAKLIVDAGIMDPIIFELVGLFQDDVGPDRVSDMSARVIRKHLYSYTEHVFNELGVDPVDTVDIEGFRLPKNPYNGKPVILVPVEILNPLPVALDWSDVDTITTHNVALRARLNETVGSTWREARTRLSKADFRQLIIEHPELLADLLTKYKGKPRDKYDYASSPLGAALLHELAVQYVKEEPLALALVKKSPDEVVAVVAAICGKFKGHIELHGGSRVLYKAPAEPHREEVAQILFYMVADAYCEANDLELSREANAGRGPVDFKIAGGYSSRVNVETKLSTNSKLLHGYQTQLEEYNKAEGAYHSFFVVIDLGNKGEWLERLNDDRNGALGAGKKAPEVIVIDGRMKPSASKI
jgi:hypothetical protein